METKFKFMLVGMFILGIAFTLIISENINPTITEEVISSDSFENYSNYSEEVLETIEEETYFKKVKNKDIIKSDYLHFNKKQITFAFSGLDFPVKKEKMRSAFKELEERVGEFNFTEIENYDEADIKVYLPKTNNLNTIAEATPILNEYNYITGGEITIIKRTDDCNYHGTEIHELLHVFGFDHNDKTIMYAYDDRCYNLKYHGNDYIEHLQFIYSSGLRGKEHSELPMLYMFFFEDSNIYKNGGNDFEDFEKEYGLIVTLKNEGETGIAEIDLINSLIDRQTEEEKQDFMWDFMDWSFAKLSEEIEAENYKVIYIRTSGEYIFNYEYLTPKWNLKNVYTAEFIDNLEIDVT